MIKECIQPLSLVIVDDLAQAVTSVSDSTREELLRIRNLVADAVRTLETSFQGINDEPESQVHITRELMANLGQTVAEEVRKLSQRSDRFSDEIRDVLGMLPVLRERAGGDRSNIRLIGMNPTITSILAVSRFEALFHLA